MKKKRHPLEERYTVPARERTCNLVISYPRSGKHWVRFIVEWFSGRPTLGCYSNPRDLRICRNILRSKVSPLRHVAEGSMPIALKSHNFRVLKEFELDQEKCSVVFLLRHCSQSVFRHRKGRAFDHLQCPPGGRGTRE
jgi:hypothetical protein